MNLWKSSARLPTLWNRRSIVFSKHFRTGSETSDRERHGRSHRRLVWSGGWRIMVSPRRERVDAVHALWEMDGRFCCAAWLTFVIATAALALSRSAD